MPKARTSKGSTHRANPMADEPGRKKGQSGGKGRGGKKTSSPSSVETDTAIYFWKPAGEHGWMSQWHESVFTDEENADVSYKTAEHYMMYRKAMLFEDPEMGLQILAAKTPKEVKALGRRVQNFDEARWMAEREGIVTRGSVLKFTRAADEAERADLRARLLATGDKELVEASPLDCIWGVGYGPKNAEANRGGSRWGLNLLGKALMEARKEIAMLVDESKAAKK